jgi:hypothetical protein
MKAKDFPQYVAQYPLTNHFLTAARAEQLKKYHDNKKGK